MTRLRIDIWSDIACPWCYVGKRRLERALASFPERAAVDVVWRAFELNPAAPVRESNETSYAARLARKYGSSVAEAQSRINQLVAVAREDGVNMDFEHIIPGNTFDAHRVLHFAHEQGLQDAVKERFLRGYLTEGEAIGERDVVARLAVDAGLDSERVSALLASDTHASDVRADEAEAQRLGIHGVPFFVIGRYALSGAQPAELFSRALGQAWAEIEQRPVAFAEGAVCGPDGC
jgi:predicted DsbA family dithiol-disulfide isomerase